MITYPSLSAVSVQDPFFTPFLDRLRTVTVADVLQKFLADGAVENYRRVAAGLVGGHKGPPWYHGLMGEVVRGVSDLMIPIRLSCPELYKKLDEQLDGLIEAMAAAQDASPDGWLNPYTTLERPDCRYGLNGGNVRWQHETYNSGALTEAGVHHFRATGKTSLLRVAVKMNNYWAARIGDKPKWNVVCEHSLPEMALIELEELLEENPGLAAEVGAIPGEYRRLAKFFVDHKGDNRARHQYPPFLQEYAQDHRPAREQREAVGHAVRATLFYTGMAETARSCGDDALKEAAYAIWRDIAETKLHINGSVGAYRDDERFGQQFELPNDAYLETCAGVGLAFFGNALFRLFPEAGIFDTVERTVFNLMPAAVSLDGVHYTYENPLESRGGRERWSWHGCPCCPPMLLKLAGALPGMIWATDGENEAYLNLYIGSSVKLPGGGEIVYRPAGTDGGVIGVRAEHPVKLRLRIPYWAHRFALSSGEYQTQDGYALLETDGNADVEITFGAYPVKIAAHPMVRADDGRVAVQFRELLYCAEKQVEKWEELDPLLDGSEPRMTEDGRLSVGIEGGGELTLIPYRSWNNSGPLPMRIWFRQAGCRTDPADLEGWHGKLYREYPLIPPHFEKIAHRGASLVKRENTVESLEYASSLGADAVECDVRPTKDGQYLIFHDPDLRRIAGVDGQIAEMTYEEIRKVVEEKAGYTPVTFDDLCAKYRGTAPILLHLKTGADPAFIEKLKNAPFSYICGVESAADVRAYRELVPAERILAFLPDETMAEEFLRAGAGIIRLWEQWLGRITPGDVKRLDPAGRAKVWIMAWRKDASGGTMNGSAEEIALCRKLGADGILMNDIVTAMKA